MLSLIVAASTNDVIGVQGALPWRLSEDLRRFRKLTMGKPIVMGRLTWESIGRALPGRRNIVMTGRADYLAQGAIVVTSPAAALDAAGEADEIMVIGGGQIYDLFFPKAGRIYLTRVDATVDGDTFFPVLDERVWQLVERESHAADDSNDHDVEFRVYERRIACPST